MSTNIITPNKINKLFFLHLLMTFYNEKAQQLLRERVVLIDRVASSRVIFKPNYPAYIYSKVLIENWV